MAKRSLRISAFAAALLWPVAGQAIQDIQDFAPMMETLNDVLNLGRSNLSMEYVSPATGNRGRVEAVRPAGDNAGQPCWQFRRSYGFPGSTKTIVGRACRTPDGLWEIVDEGPTGPAPTTTTTAAAPTTTTQPTTSLGFPATRDSATVSETQRLLLSLGYDPGPVDGKYGRRTGEAISQYQRTSGLYVDGQPSAELLAHLRASAQSSVAQAPAATQPAAPAPAAPAPAAPAPALGGDVVTQPQQAETVPAQPTTTPPTQEATAPAVAGAAGEVPVATLAKESPSRIGQSVRTSGTYLHYNGNWAKLLAEDGSSSDFVYMLLDALSETERTELRNDCFLCRVQADGRMEMRELQFAGSSLGQVPTIVVSRLVRLD